MSQAPITQREWGDTLAAIGNGRSGWPLSHLEILRFMRDTGVIEIDPNPGPCVASRIQVRLTDAGRRELEEWSR